MEILFIFQFPKIHKYRPKMTFCIGWIHIYYCYDDLNLQTSEELKILATLELPLLKRSGIFSDALTVFGMNLTTYGKVQNAINSSTLENWVQL